jgi:S1-C subfamily serine protease
MSDVLEAPTPERADGRARPWREPGPRAKAAAMFGGGALAALLGVAAWSALQTPPRPLTERDIEQTVAQVLASQVPGPPFSVPAYQVILPSLVHIQVSSAEPGPGGESGDGGRGGGLGSGVIIDESGNVLTALHVVDDASSIRLTFMDGTTAEAYILARDPDSDIALLLPDRLPSVVVPATMGNPASMRIGSEAYVVGHPLGLTASMSSGIVSGLDRTFRMPDSDTVLTGLIQVDAAINPGNSGGPLLDRAGRVTAIVSAIVNPTGDDVFIGIGLAVPIDVAGGAAGVPRY